MWEPIAKVITSTSFVPIWRGEAPYREDEHTSGYKKDRDPQSWNLIIGGQANAGGAYSGIQVRISATLGDKQQRVLTLDDKPRRWSGRAVAIEIEAALIATGETVLVAGAIAYDPDAGLPATPVLVSNLIVQQTLSRSQATTDNAITSVASMGECQRETRRFFVTAGPLSGGSAMIPVTVRIYGRRFIGQAWVRLGSMVVDQLPEGSNSLDIPVVLGQFDRIGYQVVGFPAANGGSATMFVYEELGVE